MLLGAAEVLAAVLMLVSRTATLGGMLALVCMSQVFLLNMAYDVPVKVFSLHLLALTLVVLAPQAGTLANILVLQRPSEPAVQPPLGRGTRIGTVLPVALGVLASITCLRDAWQCWHEWGYGAPEPALYGIWDVHEFNLDGHPLPPSTTDETRWQRLIVDIPGRTYQRTGLAYQRMDGTLVPTPGAVDDHTISMPGTATLTYRTQTDQLELAGDLHGHPVTVTLTRHPLDDFQIRRPGFHWIQETLPRD